MQAISIWKADTPEFAFEPLKEDLDVDVAIVGGGICGMLCAYLMARQGRRVALLEALRVGEGSTGNSTGNLYSMVGEKHRPLEDDETVRAVWRARAGGVDLIERIVQDEQIECGFARRPWVMFSEKEANPKEIERGRQRAAAAGVGVRDGSPLVPFPVRGAIVIDNQAQFNPMRFVKELAARIEGEQCRIHEHSRVTGIASGEPCTLTTESAKIRAKSVIIATHTPKGVLKVQTALGPYREYGIAATVKAGRLPEGIFWSAESPRHSIRSYTALARDHLIVVGGNHKTGQEENTEACYSELMNFAAAHFEIDSFQYRWSAQSYHAADGLPYIGQSSLGENIYIATGFAADGLTYGAVAALVLSDAIQGQRHESAGIFDTARFTPLASAKEFLTENLNVLGEYLKDIPGHADADHFSEVRPGEGKTVAVGGEKLAAYRNDEGKLHVVSAVCTHMQCIVNWNEAESTWDCPCHGSRFAPDGMVIEGPALADLPTRLAREE